MGTIFRALNKKKKNNWGRVVKFREILKNEEFDNHSVIKGDWKYLIWRSI